MTKTNTIYEVQYQTGEARDGMAPVNWMLVNIEVDGEEVELYSEYSLEDCHIDRDGYIIEEDMGYIELREDILEQAAEYGLTRENFTFWFDDVSDEEIENDLKNIPFSEPGYPDRPEGHSTYERAMNTYVRIWTHDRYGNGRYVPGMYRVADLLEFDFDLSNFCLDYPCNEDDVKDSIISELQLEIDVLDLEEFFEAWAETQFVETEPFYRTFSLTRGDMDGILVPALVAYLSCFCDETSLIVLKGKEIRADAVLNQIVDFLNYADKIKGKNWQYTLQYIHRRIM